MENRRHGKRPVMEARDVHFAYGENKILKGVNVCIPEGKVTTIMGANGCGKSTLFSLMTKSRKNYQGNIFLEGINIMNLSLKEFAKKVAIVQQYNSFAGDITVEQLISFGRTPHVKLMKGENQRDQEIIQWAISVTGLSEFREREISRLSGGQRQRVWIAMALAQETNILYLDEPTTYLDVRYQLEILELVRSLNRKHGITAVMVLHDINQAIYYSDMIVGLQDGRVVVCGNPRNVITKESIETLYNVSLDVVDIGEEKFVLPVGK